MWESHFPPISVFFPYSRSYIVHFSFFTFFNVSHDIPCLRVFLSHFSHFSDFLPYSRSYSVHFSFFKFFRITCHISRPTVYVSHFHDFQFSRHNPGPTLFVSHFPHLSLFSRYSFFLQCLCSIFPIFDFLAIYRSYSVHISFFTFFTVSCHVPGPTM